jgi:hypothetical protein
MSFMQVRYRIGVIRAGASYLQLTDP